MASLNQNVIERIPIVVPPLGAQESIAHILGTLDDKIELNRRMNETLETLAQAIFKSWFVDFDPVRAKASGEAPDSICRRLGLTHDLLALFPDGFQESELGEIPEEWKLRALYDIADYFNGLAFKNTNFSSKRQGSPIIKIAELKEGITDQTKYTSEIFAPRYQVTSGDILFSWSGSPDTSIDTFVWDGEDGWLNQHIFKIGFKRSDDKYFVYYLLRHLKPIFVEIARDKQTTGLGHVTAQDLKRLKVVVPTEKILRAFNTANGAFFEKFYNNQRESRILTTLRDTLLPKLLSGELRVKEADALMAQVT